MTPAVRWVLAIVGLLLANVVAMGVLAVCSRGAQVIPSYYEQAVRHDEHAAAAAASRALGWRATVEVSRDAIVVELRDAVGAPVRGARVRVDGYQRASASDRFELALPAIAPGRYRAVRVGRAGLHDVTVRAELGEARFVERVTREAP